MDEKSIIKKYQKEITYLKQELQQLKRGMIENPQMAESTQYDLVNLKLQVCVLMREQLMIVYSLDLYDSRTLIWLDILYNADVQLFSIYSLFSFLSPLKELTIPGSEYLNSYYVLDFDIVWSVTSFLIFINLWHRSWRLVRLNCSQD